MFPIIPFVSLFSMIGGGLGLEWYRRLDPASRDAMNRAAADLAHKIYKKQVEMLSTQQARNIYALLRARMG